MAQINPAPALIPLFSCWSVSLVTHLILQLAEHLSHALRKKTKKEIALSEIYSILQEMESLLEKNQTPTLAWSHFCITCTLCRHSEWISLTLCCYKWIFYASKRRFPRTWQKQPLPALAKLDIKNVQMQRCDSHQLFQGELEDSWFSWDSQPLTSTQLDEQEFHKALPTSW